MATLTPAYGRDYKSAKAAKADWDGGKDFVYNDMMSPFNGKYCSKSDLTGSHQLRYDKLRKVTIVKS